MLRRPMTAEKEKGAPFSEDELVACMKVLEAIALDRGALAFVDRDTRRRLLTAAGRVSIPDRAEQRRLAKAFRRQERDARKAEDEALLDATGIRVGRSEPVFVTPSPSPSPPPPEAPAGGELGSPRKCYVCK